MICQWRIDKLHLALQHIILVVPRNEPSINPNRIVRYYGGATTIVKGVLMYFPIPIFPKIGGEITREVLIELHQLVSGNEASVSSNLRGGRHEDLMLIMTSEG